MCTSSSHPTGRSRRCIKALIRLSLTSNCRDLAECQLRDLPPQIGSLTRLTRLDLHSNALETVPPDIGRLVRVERLSLHSNDMRSVPPELGQMTALNWL